MFQTLKSGTKVELLFFSKFSGNFKQLLFLWQCGKKSFLDHFCTTKNLYLPQILGDHAGGSDLTIFENRFSGPQKWSKKLFFGVLIKTKVARN